MYCIDIFSVFVIQYCCPSCFEALPDDSPIGNNIVLREPKWVHTSKDLKRQVIRALNGWAPSFMRRTQQQQQQLQQNSVPTASGAKGGRLVLSRFLQMPFCVDKIVIMKEGKMQITGQQKASAIVFIRWSARRRARRRRRTTTAWGVIAVTDISDHPTK